MGYFCCLIQYLHMQLNYFIRTLFFFIALGSDIKALGNVLEEEAKENKVILDLLRTKLASAGVSMRHCKTQVNSVFYLGQCNTQYVHSN